MRRELFLSQYSSYFTSTPSPTVVRQAETDDERELLQPKNDKNDDNDKNDKNDDNEEVIKENENGNDKGDHSDHTELEKKLMIKLEECEEHIERLSIKLYRYELTVRKLYEKLSGSYEEYTHSDYESYGTDISRLTQNYLRYIQEYPEIGRAHV